MALTFDTLVGGLEVGQEVLGTGLQVMVLTFNTLVGGLEVGQEVLGTGLQFVALTFVTCRRHGGRPGEPWDRAAGCGTHL